VGGGWVGDASGCVVCLPPHTPQTHLLSLHLFSTQETTSTATSTATTTNCDDDYNHYCPSYLVDVEEVGRFWPIGVAPLDRSNAVSLATLHFLADLVLDGEGK
jgi:hypothetical protein